MQPLNNLEYEKAYSVFVRDIQVREFGGKASEAKGLNNVQRMSVTSITCLPFCLSSFARARSTR